MVGVSVLVALLIAELFLRFLHTDPIRHDPILEFAHDPGADWDMRGFRNPTVLEYAHIVAIGDSQTEGNNATSEESWPHVLGVLASTSVYSMAVQGYGPVQYAALVEQALALKPRVIVIGLYLGNDLSDAERVTYGLDHWRSLRDESYTHAEADGTETDFRTILGSGVRQGSLQYRVLKVRMWIRSHSRLYALIGNATRGIRERLHLAYTLAEKQEALKVIAQQQPDIAYVYDEESRFKTVLSPTYRLDTVDLSEPRTAEGWRITKERLRAIKTMTSEHNIQVIVAIIPTKEMVYVSYMEAMGQVVTSNFKNYETHEHSLTNTILSFCDHESIVCRSVLRDMTNAMKSGTTLYGITMDGHPKANGYKIIAESIFKTVIPYLSNI